MAGVDETIGSWVKSAEQSGELKSGRFWGKPLNLDNGFEATPQRLRIAYRILKNAGYMPAEVEMFKQLASLRDDYRSATDPDRKRALRAQITALEQKVAVMLDKLKHQR